MNPSIFTKIINGEIPCHKVYEDDKTLAFLDIHPVQPGMTLVVSKAQVANFEDLNDEDYQATWQTVKKVALKLRETFPDKLKIAVHVEGLEVAHTHIKIFPIDNSAEFHAQADLSQEPDHSALAKLAESLKF
ncbi:MAG: HIT domain-containing protein [bacterium]|nr:HIT domain-containing protein [bacterium]